MFRSTDPKIPQPLKPKDFLILLTLAGREHHGYGLVKAIEEQSPGLRVEPANLYRTLRTLESRGWIEESDRRPDDALDDARRRYFRITDRGAAAVRAETERLQNLLGRARTLSVLPGSD